MSNSFDLHNLAGPEGRAHISDHDFLVVGIGASAGGIKAFREFFANVPSESGIAYVVILHLSPKHESHLADVLQLSTGMPVRQVRGEVKIEPNHIYVIPPNQSLTINDGYLALSSITRIEERRAPVDIFFRTLAESKGPRAVCIVLSGTGADGSMGLKRVKERGGVSIAQEPHEAEYPDMPRNSIATGLVDYVLPVAEIPRKIIAFKERLGQTRIPVEPEDRAETDEQALHAIFTELRVGAGHDFSNYKRATVLRRIERRINVHELQDLQAYAAFMREHPAEARALLKDLLISVTTFFRDCHAFEAVERTIIRRLFDGKGSDDQVRLWVAGCATGEEAYSIAMLLREHEEKVQNAPGVQVFATDIDENAIALARAGFYTKNDAADASAERLSRFFIQENGGYRVQKELREMVLFAQHNMIKDPPFSQLNMISCRNLLIYLNRTAQERLMQVLHFALNPGGFLFLGTSESIEGSGDLFLTIDKEAHIYQSRALSSRVPLPIPEFAVSHYPMPQRDVPSREPRANERLSYGELHQRLVEQYAPPSVVVNEEYDIVHLSERAGQYLQVPGGEPSRNLLKVARPELRMELRTALYEAVRNLTSVEARNVPLLLNGSTQYLNLLVRPVFAEGDSARGFVLVIFEDAGESGRLGTPQAAMDAEPAARQMEDELIRVKAQLRATVEQYETQTEELKASNEELQATNEELRSTTEELETSKEELQSVNEELTTINQELRITIEELSQANNDFMNLMNSTQIGTIFLDRSLRVKLFTPRARDIFNLLPSDAGRPLSDITGQVTDADLLPDLERVISTVEPVQREVKTRDGRCYLMNILPYRTADERIAGAIITFLDVTGSKAAEEQLRASEERLRLLIDSVTDYSIIIQNTDGCIQVWNPGAERMFGYKREEAVGKSIEILFTPEDRARGAHIDEMKKAREQGHAADERWHLRKDGSRFYVSGVLTLLRDNDLTGYAKIARDLTDSKRTEEELRRAREELEHKVEERTRELEKANDALQVENAERRRIERARLELLRQLVRSQEDERRRIARDIHDHLGQQLTALRLKLEALKNLCSAYQDLCEPIEETRKIAARVDADVDFLAWELRPASLDDLGLAPALANFIKEWSRHFDIAAEFHTTGMDKERASPEVETSLYRIAQEALNNCCKHAQATRMDILLERRDSSIVLIIEDNGVGFDPADRTRGGRGLGLLGMRERAALVGGTLEIEASHHNGTTIFARVPVKFPHEGTPGV